MKPELRTEFSARAHFKELNQIDFGVEEFWTLCEVPKNSRQSMKICIRYTPNFSRQL